MAEFLSQHRLPAEFRSIAEQHYLPLAKRLPQMRDGKRQLLLGVNGAQGTGKSTLADFLRLATASMFDWNVAVLSIDDFYYTLAERTTLAEEVHPLLKTRGVPGTHDTDMLAGYLERLQQLENGEQITLPRFDKSIDDRADESRWPVVKGPVDLVILEGWCVGTQAQADAELLQPINALERDEDPDGIWRQYVNNQLRAKYEPIFCRLDALIFIGAPNFDAILRWRMEQEEKLAASSPAGSSGLMNKQQITRFIQFYERLTKVNLATLPDKADFVFRLDDSHAIVS
ncbi:MAG: phosphoribulokinase [Woeseiaceae bacterium]|nr:phosphoribulokinase [Woeseiaceae bacterium]